MTIRDAEVIVQHNDPDAINLALGHLRVGDIVAIPTETVYGLAADATRGTAVAKVFEAKGRPSFNPLICHVSSLTMAKRFAVFNETALALAKAFWPGPLTLVLPVRESHLIHPLVTADLETVAVRVPTGIARHIIKALGVPLAVPSANRSGGISPTSAEAVHRSLGDAVPLIIDAGSCSVGVESTIIKPDKERTMLLRPGGIAAEAIGDVLGFMPTVPAVGSPVNAPGQLLSHYAPSAKVRINAERVHTGEALLEFGPERIPGSEKAIASANLSMDGDLIEAAANLFALLDELDRSGASVIAVEPVPTYGLGEAINDRLRRAAAPRDQKPVNEIS